MNDWCAIEKEIVYIIPAKIYGIAVSKKQISKDICFYHIFTDATPSGYYVATNKEIDFLE